MKIVSVKDVFATILLIVSTMIIAFIELMLNEVTTNAGLLRFILKNSEKTLCQSGLSIRDCRDPPFKNWGDTT